MIILNAVKTLSLAIPFALAAIFSGDPGLIDGKYFPVVGDFRLVNERPTDDGRVSIDLNLKKLRTCRFVAIEFYMQSDDAYWYYTPVIVDPAAGHGVTIPVGAYSVTFKLSAPSWLIGHPIKAVTHHKCYGPTFWTTDTVLMVGRAENLLNSVPQS